MQEIQLNDWTTYKGLLSTKGMAVQYVEFSDRYELYAAEAGIFTWRFSLAKSGGSDQTDFETNYKPTANAPLMINGNEISAPPMAESVVFNALAIRDTSAHNGTTSQNFGYRVKTIIVNNGLDQTVTLQCQGSRDGTNWINIGTTWDVVANSQIYQTCETYFPYLRAIATCSVSPTTGTLSLWLEKVGV